MTYIKNKCFRNWVNIIKLLLSRPTSLKLAGQLWPVQNNGPRFLKKNN